MGESRRCTRSDPKRWQDACACPGCLKGDWVDDLDRREVEDERRRAAHFAALCRPFRAQGDSAPPPPNQPEHYEPGWWWVRERLPDDLQLPTGRIDDGFDLVGVPQEEPSPYESPWEAPTGIAGTPPRLVRVKDTPLGGFRTWVHVVVGSQDGPDGVVLSGLNGSQDAVRMAFLPAGDLKGSTGNLREYAFDFHEVSAQLPQAQEPIRINDIWHVYAHGFHWLAYSAGPKDEYLYLVLVQETVSQAGSVHFQRTHDFTVRDPIDALGMGNANDHALIPVENGVAVVSASDGSGLVACRYEFTSEPQPDFVEIKLVARTVFGGFDAGRGTVGYRRHLWRAVQGHQRVIDVIATNSLQPTVPTEITHLILDPKFENLLASDTLIVGADYVDPEDPGQQNVSMATLVSLDPSVEMPASAGPSLRPSSWRLLTYRVFRKKSASEHDETKDGGNIHRRWYHGLSSDYADSSGWRPSKEQKVNALGGGGVSLDDLKAGRGDLGWWSRNRPHTVRWRNYVITTYDSSYDKDTRASHVGATVSEEEFEQRKKEAGCRLLLDEIVWP